MLSVRYKTNTCVGLRSI